MTTYEPLIIENPKTANVISAWGNIPTILKDIINRFNINPKVALEFGVEYGYSTSALANYFEKVIGVDTFIGDRHSGEKINHLKKTLNNLKEWNNIELIQSDFESFIEDNGNIYDLIHVDIIHDYEPTYRCGEWAINHSKVTIFHDTESFPEIKKVCFDF